ncbi:twin-arginine translocase subunit TatC [Paramicrobacterium sp. CJ85]|uniref:twin-arginine translocase subunit TatC n=1 Tax=Paramicrobacterium sp. CJ85 TaxID=3445355 RepID=UPI003F645AB9
MTLGEHLLELRKRLFIAAIAIVVGMVIGFLLSNIVIELMSAPIEEIAETKNASLNFDTVTSGFDLHMKVALTIGFVISAPVWLYQIWAFLVPGLKRNEVRYILGFILTAIPLFFAGCFAGWIVMPHIVELMARFTPQDASNLYQAGYYYDFILKLVLAVGIAFVLPVFLVLLNFVGVLSAKAIIKGWRVALLVIMLFCAIATPAADVISMFLLAVPMIILYFAAYVVAYFNDRRRAKRAAKLEEEYRS